MATKKSPGKSKRQERRGIQSHLKKAVKKGKKVAAKRAARAKKAAAPEAAAAG